MTLARRGAGLIVDTSIEVIIDMQRTAFGSTMSSLVSITPCTFVPLIYIYTRLHVL